MEVDEALRPNFIKYFPAPRRAGSDETSPAKKPSIPDYFL
jgi:hypothetical protein